MSCDVTVLYYSSNREDPHFETKVMEKIMTNKGDLPLVSVTQKPFPNFGHNICVGQHDSCYTNEFRQIQIGLQAVTTPYVLTAEADCLYPPEYFQFRPEEKGHVYRYGNVWVHYYLDPNKRQPKFFYKKFSDGAQAIDKKLWLSRIDPALEGFPEWTKATDTPHKAFASRYDNNHFWTSENPVITFKTTNGVARYTQVKRDTVPQSVLPFWGSAELLRKELFL